MANTLLELSFSQVYGFSGSLLGLSFAQKAELSGRLLDLSFAQRQTNNPRLLDLSFATVSGSLKRRFRGDQAINFDDFDVLVHIDGLPVPMCDLAQTMTIERGENESAILDFMMRPAACRGVDLFAWYGKPITVDVRDNTQIVRLFTGFVDKNVHNPLGGTVSLRCSERREQMINSLPKETIQSIGYVSGSEEFETQKDELDARLNTVPASFEISPNGAISLTPWLPKTTPDFIMQRCYIYQRNFALELNEISGMTNVVNASVVVDYPRLLQRSVFVRFDSGLNVCQYSRYVQMPDIYEFQSAIEQTGWQLGGFDCERIEKSGLYNCDGTTLMHYRNPIVDASRDEEAGVTVITRMRNLDVKSGTFELVKRWNQSVRHEFVLRVVSPESVARFGENIAKSSYNISHTLPESTEWQALDWHDKKLRYTITTNDRLDWLPFASQSAPKLDKYTFSASENGDWFTDVLPEKNQLTQTLKVAYHAAYTQILKAHRQTVSLECKFIPHADLTQTHAIEHSQFSGSAKVSKITHHFDFERKLGYTALAYQFFYLHGKINQQYTDFVEPPRQIPPTQPYNKWLKPLGRVELDKTEEQQDDEVGMIYRLGAISQGVKLFQAVELVVATPEIEEKSTQTLEFKQNVSCNVNVFDGEIVANLC